VEGCHTFANLLDLMVVLHGYVKEGHSGWFCLFVLILSGEGCHFGAAFEVEEETDIGRDNQSSKQGFFTNVDVIDVECRRSPIRRRYCLV
jgi:hypothetical protein